MGHLTSKKSHRILRDQLDRYPMGAPGNTLILDILETIYSAEEAKLAAELPLGFSSPTEILSNVDMPLDLLKSKLDSLADKGLVIDLEVGGETKYCLPPTLVGLFEFSMMRVREDIDQKKLAGLYYRYLVEEPDYFLQIRNNTTTPFRTMIHEETIPADYSEVLDYEKASEVIKNADLVAVGLCHCRHVKHHLGRDCKVFEMETCLSFGKIADYLVRRNFARKIERTRANEMISEAKSRGMVHICDNVQYESNFLCNCCKCCCEVIESFKNFGFLTNTFSSNFEAEIESVVCDGCLKCFKACPVDAIEMVEADKSSEKRNEKVASVNLDVCIGCGVCVPTCKHGAIKMTPRPQRRIIPENTIARTLTMAIEKGTLKELIVERHATMSNAAIGAFIGAITRLPPGKQLLAKEAIKSRFVEFLMSRI